MMDAIYRTDFASFIAQVFSNAGAGKSLQMNWHIYALAFQLELVRLGKNRRLIINMPPRSLKSMITSVAFPAFVLGHDPTKPSSWSAIAPILRSNLPTTAAQF